MVESPKSENSFDLDLYYGESQWTALQEGLENNLRNRSFVPYFTKIAQLKALFPNRIFSNKAPQYFDEAALRLGNPYLGDHLGFLTFASAVKIACPEKLP